MSNLNSSDKLRQILEDHELYRSVRKMSSYAASSMGTYHPGSPSQSQATLPAFEHKLPRAHLTSNSGKASPSIDQNPTDQDNTEVDVENSILVSKLPRVKNKTIWPLGTNSMHRLTPAELEKQLKKMKNTQVISICMDMASQLRLLEKQSSTKLEKINEEDELSISEDLFDSISSLGRTRCRFSVSGCPFRLPSMEEHELRECKFRPARCPSLTCPVRPPFAKLLRHIDEDHDGSVKGRDRVCRNNSNHLVSSYVNVDKEPIFYKTSRMTWVANELILEGKYHFFLECMRIPPEWYIWVYYLGDEAEAEAFQVTVTLFREDEYGRMNAGFSAQRSYTGPVVSINRSKEEIAEYGLGFMVHDKQVRTLCGPISSQEEQLFGYEVTVYRK